jgi:pimeloyl-ACP methyl ester carboxylesterase
MSAAAVTPPKRHHFTDGGGIRLHFATCGSGKPVVLLHGFPETHRSWDLQHAWLTDAGYRTIAVDLRGYGKSAKPDVGYDLRTLAADIAQLISGLGAGPVPVIGHDWGGGITWELASRHPDQVERAIVLDCPHPALMARALRTNPRQIRRSWYMFFFQLPGQPERWLTKNGGRNLARMFRSGSVGPEVDAIVRTELESLLSPGALAGPLAYYRTAFRQDASALLSGKLRHPYPRIACPVTLIWGADDSCLGPELIHGTTRFAAQLDVSIVPRAGHFVHQERPDVVNPLLLRALGAPGL